MLIKKNATKKILCAPNESPSLRATLKGCVAERSNLRDRHAPTGLAMTVLLGALCLFAFLSTTRVPQEIQNLIVVGMIRDLFDIFGILDFVVRTDHENRARQKPQLFDQNSVGAAE